MTGERTPPQSRPPATSRPRATAESPPDDRHARARRAGRRAAHALILLVAVLFVGSSAWQLVRAVFLGDAGAQAAGPLDPTCADGLRRLSSALDRAAASVLA